MAAVLFRDGQQAESWFDARDVDCTCMLPPLKLLAVCAPPHDCFASDAPLRLPRIKAGSCRAAILTGESTMITYGMYREQGAWCLHNKGGTRWHGKS